MREEILSIASDLREGYMTTDEAKRQLLLLFNDKQREQLVCDYCGQDKVEGLDHCKCYNGTTWVNKKN